MNHPALRLSLATLVLVLAGLAGVWFLRQRDRNLRQQEARVQSEFDTNRQRRAALRLSSKPTPPGAPATAAIVSPPALAPISNQARAQQTYDRLRAMPEYARFLRCDLRRQTMRKYGELFAELKLTPERLAAFKSVLDDLLGTSQDAHDLAVRAGYGQLSSEYTKLTQRSRADGRQRVCEFLGPEDAAKFERFEKSAGWRNHQQFELAEYLADRGVPVLTTEQARLLTQAYVDAQTRTMSEAMSGANAAAKARQRDAKLGELAAPALSPAQHAALIAYLDFNSSRGEILARLFYSDRPPGSVTVSATIMRP